MNLTTLAEGNGYFSNGSLLLSNVSEEDLQSNINHSDCDDRSPVWIPTTELIISVVGLIFNGIAIFVIIVLKDYKKSISHWYVLQLAIADSLFLAMLPLRAHEHIIGRWSMPDWLCGLFQGIFMQNYYAGIFFLTVMSFDRYVAIVHSVSAPWRKIRTHGNAVIITACVWVSSLMLAVPLWHWSSVSCSCSYSFPWTEEEFRGLHGVSEMEYDELQIMEVTESDLNNYDFTNFQEYTEKVTESDVLATTCVHNPWMSLRIWFIANFVLAFAIPVLIMAVCYSLILWRVLHPAIRSANKTAGGRKSSDAPSRGRRPFRLSSTSSSSKSPKQKQKVTGIVVSLVLLFLMCWLPFHVFQLSKFQGFHYSMETCTLMNDIICILAYANSMLNPIFYTFLGSRFGHRLTSATSTIRRNRRSSSRFYGFSRNRSARNCAPSSGRNFGVTGFTKATDGTSSTHTHTIHTAIVTKANQTGNPADKCRLLSTALADNECGDAAHPNRKAVLIEMRSLGS